MLFESSTIHRRWFAYLKIYCSHNHKHISRATPIGMAIILWYSRTWLTEWSLNNYRLGLAIFIVNPWAPFKCALRKHLQKFTFYKVVFAQVFWNSCWSMKIMKFSTPYIEYRITNWTNFESCVVDTFNGRWSSQDNLV